MDQRQSASAAGHHETTQTTKTSSTTKKIGKVVVGIDCGLDGAMVGLSMDQGVVFREPMPVIGSNKGKRQYDAERIRTVLEKNKAAVVFLEKQQPMARWKDGEKIVQGVTATFRTGYGFGLIRGILVGMKLAHAIVPAKTWQKEMLVGEPVDLDVKVRSALAAQRWFPGVDMRRTDRCRTPHDGICDAILLALWGVRRSG